MATLPEELTEDILSSLPVKSLLRFKSASKNWYSLISQNHKFAKVQLKSSSSSKNLIFYKIGADAYESSAIFRYSDIDSHESRGEISFPIEIATPCRVIGSANGLICVASMYEGDCCFIWNPCTGEFKRIFVPLTKPGLRLIGFGYDSISDDYKIVGNWGSQIRCFSLKKNSWKILDCPVSSSMYVSAFYSNGALHWCIGPEIIAFDLVEDEFFFLDLPEESKFVGSNYSAWVPLFTDYQGSLCASGRKSIWAMKEYGNSNSWTKLSTSLPLEYAKPVSISRNGEVGFITGTGFLTCDVKGRMSDDDDDDDDKMNYFGDAFVYTESLISPYCCFFFNLETSFLFFNRCVQ